MRWVLAGLALFAAFAGEAQARRVALVIGQSAYRDAPALTNPERDARLVASALLSAGFDDVSIRTDLDKQALEQALAGFSRAAEGAETALIYFAGHGLESGGRNWLVPVDARIAREVDIATTSVAMDTMIRALDGARGLKVLVLDACRNNRLQEGWQAAEAAAGGRRFVLRGLGGVEIRDALVLYAAKAGTAAQEGAGSANSPFAAALARRLVEPGLEIRRMFGSVRDDVVAATGGAQEPFTYGTLSGEGHYFVSADPAATLADADEQTWVRARTLGTEEGYATYLRLYPDGKRWVEATLQQSELVVARVKREEQAKVGRRIAVAPRGSLSLEQAIKDAEGAIVDLAPGEYMIADDLLLADRITLRGPSSGAPAIIRGAPKDNNSLISMLSADVTLQDLTVECDCDAISTGSGKVRLLRMKVRAGGEGEALTSSQDGDVVVVDSELVARAAGNPVFVAGAGRLIIDGSQITAAAEEALTGLGRKTVVVSHSRIVTGKGDEDFMFVSGVLRLILADSDIDARQRAVSPYSGLITGTDDPSVALVRNRIVADPSVTDRLIDNEFAKRLTDGNVVAQE